MGRKCSRGCGGEGGPLRCNNADGAGSVSLRKPGRCVEPGVVGPISWRETLRPRCERPWRMRIKDGETLDL